MDDDLINVLVSEEYLLLRWLSQHTTQTRSVSVVKFSQNELAQEFDCSPTTINKRMQLLKKINCIEQYRKKGNYIITDVGRKVISKMDEIESIIGGTKQCC